MRNSMANGETVLQSALTNGAIESKSRFEEQDLGERAPPCSKQNSMRKSRVSGELERDAALSTVQSATKLPTIMPLIPITPLRWKSTKRIESERRKLQEEIKTKGVVKEEKKNTKLAKEERKDQSKMATTTTRVNGIETPHAVDTPTSNHFTSQEDEMFTSSVSALESTGMISIDAKAEGRKHFHPITDGGSNKHTKHYEGVSFLNAKHGTDQTIGESSKTNRKPLIGDESIAVTIDFLRARLLAERASSKVAKERIQQLTQKVQELEGKLNQEILSCQRAKEEEQEALMRVESLNVSLPRENAALFEHEKTKIDEQVQELDQADGNCQGLVDVNDPKSNASVDIKQGLTQSASLEVNELLVSEVETSPMVEQEIGGHQSVQSLDKNGSPDVKRDGIPIVPSMASRNGDACSPTNSKLKQQEKRSSIEERLQHLWNQMAVEVGALAKDKTIEDCLQEGLLKWMHQFPIVVSNILPKASETMELRSLDGASCSNGSRAHYEDLKKVASLIERFEANESIQREREESIVKQMSMSKRCNNKGSLSRANDSFETLLSMEPQQMHQQEITIDEPLNYLLQVEDSSCYSLTTESSISPHEGMTPKSLLMTKDNGRVDTYTPSDNTPLTYPNSPIVGAKARQSSEDKITPISMHDTIDPSLEHTKFGLHGSMDASLLLSPSFEPRVGKKGGDISIIPEDKSQIVRQSNHQRAFDGNCMTFESHSKRSTKNIEEPTRSQALIGWLKPKEMHMSLMLTNTRDHNSPQWDTPIKSRCLQHERLAPYSQAGSSNAYVKPDHYPIRNDEREIYHGRMESVSRSMEGLGNNEREIYRGRMESVSRSMEGLGSSWRSLSDAEGDETLLLADMPDAIASSAFRRFGPLMPFQANGGSGWSNFCQPENMEGTSQCFAYPGRDFARENFRSRSASSNTRRTSSEVNEVLKALQLAKLSIQNSGTKKSTISNSICPTSERSYAEGDGHNLRTDYGFSDGRMTNETPTALRVWSHPEISRSYSAGTFRGAGSATSHLHPSNSVPVGMLLDAHRNYPEDKYSTGRS